jgi:hypothetical protein
LWAFRRAIIAYDLVHTRTAIDVQQRLMDLLQQADNEFVDTFLSDPDNPKILVSIRRTNNNFHLADP